MQPYRVDFRELDNLPRPVQRYFRAVLRDCQPMIAAVDVRYTGTFNMGEADDRWRSFTSQQRVVLRRPGFDWNARMAMLPGFGRAVGGCGRQFRARDAYRWRGSVTLLFMFNDDGHVERVRAEARGRTVDGVTVTTPWEGRFWNYTERDGIRIPLDKEVVWLLAEGEIPYWRGRISAVTYEVAQ